MFVCYQNGDMGQKNFKKVQKEMTKNPYAA